VSKEDEKSKTIDTPKKKKSLKVFIDENYHLFTVMGVFGGLAALFTRLENAEYLAFLTFTMLIFLDWELWTSFPKSDEASVNLKIFEWLSQIFLVMIAVYLCMAYPTYVVGMLPIILLAVFAGIFILLDRRLKFYTYIRRIAPEGKWYAPLVRGLVAGAIILSAGVLSFAIANYLRNLVI